MTGSESAVHAKRTAFFEPAFGAVRKAPRLLFARLRVKRKKYFLPGLSRLTLRWTVLSAPLRARSLNVFAPRLRRSARVHSTAAVEVTSAEATPLEKPLAEAVAGRAAASAASASRQRARFISGT